MGRALFVSGMLMMLSNATFAILAAKGHSNTWLFIAVATEQVTSGIGLTVFATYLSGLANLAYTATQFALLSSFAVVGRTWLSTPSGYVADTFGWVGFWIVTMIVALPGLVLMREAGGASNDFLALEGIQRGNPLLLASQTLYPQLKKMILQPLH